MKVGRELFEDEKLSAFWIQDGVLYKVWKANNNENKNPRGGWLIVQCHGTALSDGVDLAFGVL